MVDANFRQPMIGSLPQCPEGGLSNALVGQSHWRGPGPRSGAEPVGHAAGASTRPNRWGPISWCTCWPKWRRDDHFTFGRCRACSCRTRPSRQSAVDGEVVVLIIHGAGPFDPGEGRTASCYMLGVVQLHPRDRRRLPPQAAVPNLLRVPRGKRIPSGTRKTGRNRPCPPSNANYFVDFRLPIAD